MKRAILAATIVLGLTVGLAVAPASASTIFNLGPNDATTYRLAGSGPGQGVAVSTTTTISQMAMEFAMPSGGHIKYMIWNGANSTLLYSQTMSVAAGFTSSFLPSAPFSFTLNAGRTYWFGVIGDNDLNVDYIYTPFSYSANGLTAVTTGNSNYSNFSNPVFANTAYAEIGLRLYNDTNPVPEPASLLLLGTGLLGIGTRLRLWRRV